MRITRRSHRRFLGLGAPAWAVVFASVVLLAGVRLYLENEFLKSMDGDDHGYFSHEWFVERRARAIDRELSDLGPAHPWAGRYRKGYGGREGVALAPSAGYVREVLGNGEIQREQGRVRTRDGLLFLDGAGSRTLAGGVLPVQWGRRHYLVSQYYLVDFANAVNQGFEPRSESGGSYLLREGDEKIDVVGLPELPAEARAVLRTRPLAAAIEAIGAEEHENFERSGVSLWVTTYTTVMLNVGSRQGAVPMLELRACGGEYGEAQIVKVYETTSLAFYRRQDGEVSKPPRKGEKLATRCADDGARRPMPIIF